MKRVFVVFLVLCLGAAVGLAQDPEGGAPPAPPSGGGPAAGPGAPAGPHNMHGGGMRMRHHGDPLQGLMFPPEHILNMAEELNLTPEQKTSIRNEVKTNQPKFTDLQFQLQDQMQAFTKLLHADKTDEKAAMAALDQVLDTERQIKRLHVGMIVRIKNMLTKEQVEKLHNMHERMGPMKMRRGPEGGGPGAPSPEGSGGDIE